jgi:hypothetical protein
MIKSPMRRDRADAVWARQIRRIAIHRIAIHRIAIHRIALAGALSLLALASFAPSAARAEDGEGGLWGSMLKTLGIGGENNIEYRERPPLVVPPTHDLPPPQTSASTTVRDPNWPVDPSANRQAAEKPKKGNQIRDLDKIPVAPRPAGPSMAGSGTPGPYPGGADTTAALPPPSQPTQSTQPAASGGFFGKIFSSSNDKPTGPIIVPTRKSLIEPPPDFESPSPSQPYGAAPSRPDPAKAVTPESAATATPPGSTGPGSSGL